MNELTRHIEALLLKHDCVIIPGLGGFVSQYVEAYYVKEESTFFPPHRTVGFNPQLTLNDGLLVQSFMQAYDANYPEALLMIEQKVEQVKGELHKSNNCNFEGIGSLSLTLNGVYTFSPFESGVITPALYGLTSFQMKSASEISISTTKKQTMLSEDSKTVTEKATEGKAKPIVGLAKEKKHYTISINRTIANYAITSVAAVLLYLMVSIPVENSNNFSGSDTAASKGIFMGLTPLLYNNKAIEQTPKTIEAEQGDKTTLLNDNSEDIGDVSRPIESNKVEVKKELTTEVCLNSDSRDGYTIVLASAVSLKNAKAFVSDLHNQGFEDARVYQKGKMTRVVLSRYDSEAAAHQALNELRSNEMFNQAWILSIK